MKLACVDGRVVPEQDAVISVTDEGLLRGDGVFEVVRLYDGRPFGLAEHLARLELSARNLRLDCDVTEVAGDIVALLEATADPVGMVRALVTRGGRRIVLLEPLPTIGPTISLATVTYSPTRILDGIKSLSYAANMLASRIACEEGADEALLVTPHGRVLEAPTAAFFWVRGDDVVTPPLAEHLLDSITRRVVMEVTGAHEEVTTRDNLAQADEAFLASTTREVMGVHAIDGRALPGGPVTADVAARVSERIGVLVAAG